MQNSASLEKRRLAWAFAGYQAFYMVLFAQFPLQRALPGNTDTMLVIALSNTYWAKIAAWLGFGPAGQAMYPAENVLAYGESAPGGAALFLLFKLLGFNDINAYYFYITLIFSLTAWAIFLFSGLFVQSVAARVFAGFAATCSNMFFAHIDDSIVVFYFLPFVTFTLVFKAFREHRLRLLWMAGLMGGLQAYFSVYLLVYQSVLLLALCLYLWSSPRSRLSFSSLIVTAAIYAAVALPLLYFYSAGLARYNIEPVYDPPFITRVMSWQFRDALVALPGNLLYGGLVELPQNWPQLRHHNLMGGLVVAGALWGLTRRGEHRVICVSLAAIGFLLALGPEFMVGNEAIAPTPLYPFYEQIPIFKFHRIAVRAYALVVIAAAILSAVALQHLLFARRNKKLALALIAGVFAFHVLENVPFPMRAYKVGPWVEIPPEYREFTAALRKQSDENVLLLDLPTRFGFRFETMPLEEYQSPQEFLLADPEKKPMPIRDYDSVSLSTDDIFLYSRDIYYLNWQTYHRHDIVGGIQGYFPGPRLVFQRWIEELPAEYALGWLRKQGVDYIVYHKGMKLPGDIDLLPGLEASPSLRRVFSGERMVAFAFTQGAD